jgi:hypothetical protein
MLYYQRSTPLKTQEAEKMGKKTVLAVGGYKAGSETPLSGFIHISNCTVVFEILTDYSPFQTVFNNSLKSASVWTSVAGGLSANYGVNGTITAKQWADVFPQCQEFC